ncbi:hypothetical protein EA462_12460 [Natrarchaeobius halalkaliphilus]|uniref:DUF1102 domain-containing protein n=1 Tax=Natrarchaeobius halalkaliphilus TaxID=1679091 RepID=A0A3N6LK91_9EURY|nr:hypothetical protein [Natrarchaeobius halalkaliphilus]RQG89173.1 hypothetical protein EA462_12460 [Natrarchaeobius halalkaliphilus]
MIQRRQVVLGLGALAAGAGLIGGSGAFDSVEADRDVSVEFSGDGDAVLGMSSADADREFVTVEADDDGVVGMTIERLNQNARTAVSNLIAFTNNGSRPIETITATIDDRSENAAVVVHDDLSGIPSIGVGETVVGLGLTIDTREENGHAGSPDVMGEIRIHASTLSEE